MIKNLAGAALFFIVFLGLSTANVDFVCMILWHFDSQESETGESAHFPHHHPHAPESHVDSADHNDNADSFMISLVLGYSILQDQSYNQPILNVIQTPFELQFFTPDIFKDPQLRPPQLLS